MTNFKSQPTDWPRWATMEVISPITGIANSVSPPESKRNVGWQTFEPANRNFTNFLHKMTYEWLVYLDSKVNDGNKTTDGNGVELFPIHNAILTLYAVDKTNPANFIHAVGYRGTGAPVMTVISSNTLSLDTPTSNGSVPILGVAPDDVIVNGQSNNIINT